MYVYYGGSLPNDTSQLSRNLPCSYQQRTVPQVFADWTVHPRSKQSKVKSELVVPVINRLNAFSLNVNTHTKDSYNNVKGQSNDVKHSNLVKLSYHS